MSGIEEITHNKNRQKELVSFLKQFDLAYENDIDYTVAIYDKGHIIATASKSKQVLKCFAVDEAYQGRGLSSTLIKKIEDRMFEEGLYHFFIYTKSCNKTKFISIGYREVITSNGISILENGNQTIQRFINKLKEQNQITSVDKACIIMNANPFTLGHRYLVEQAARNHNEVIVFVVTEDQSSFPFHVRYQLVNDGVNDLSNVTVLETGPYLISQATFPTYFLKQGTDALKLHTKIDCDVFLKYYKKAFTITTRYVGEEPYCSVTRSYNDTMKQMLENGGVKVTMLKRKKQNGQYISASSVRSLLKEEDYDAIKELVPETTFRFLTSDAAVPIIEKIKNSNERH
ncbi:[citrate (pro-3S)-lyase] ligase [Haloplasma contractile]|uniref:[Citrate [pro-3S]-lyase] ligase n=1 Tax=Haloplasma contractile SSD-17B TaxID=1033810 RepID=U2E0A6_9MOLU|nr:[citrate (pro-3S)-lyase] ligase [Haloplasma contractile]ERJ13857.1 citrate -lyase ligase protein [Haloplasma contractile SSD-17B]